MRIRLELEGEPYDVTVRATPEGFDVECEGESAAFQLMEAGPVVRLRRGDRTHRVEVASDAEALLDGARLPFHVAGFEPGPAVGAEAGGRVLVRAPMAGRLARVRVEAGASVARGAGLFVLEAMKMQNEIVAPAEGRVVAIRVREGDVVEPGRVLAELETAGAARKP